MSFCRQQALDTSLNQFIQDFLWFSFNEFHDTLMREAHLQTPEVTVLFVPDQKVFSPIRAV